VPDNEYRANAYWSQPLENLWTALQAKPQGLSSNEAKERLEKVGLNLLERKEKVTPLRLFLEHLRARLS